MTAQPIRRHHTLSACECGAECNQLSEDCRGFTAATGSTEHLCDYHLSRRDYAVIEKLKAEKREKTKERTIPTFMKARTDIPRSA
jgi:hypothetical protein